MTKIWIIGLVFSSYSDCMLWAIEHDIGTANEEVAFCTEHTSDTDAPLVSLRPKLRPEQ